MADSTKPYFLLVTGSFALPSMYDSLVEAMKERGYELKAVHLPTVGVAPGKGRDVTPPPTMYDDAAAIAKEVQTLADAGREVILVAHSYGGIPATESTKGLSVQERKKAGKKGGLVRLAYKTVVLTTPGHTAAEVLAQMPQTGRVGLQPDEKGWLHQTDPEQSARNCFSDLPLEEALARNKEFALHSGVSFTNPLTHAGYKDVPVSYLVCEGDLVISPEIQRAGIEMVEKETGDRVDVTSIRSGHCPSVSVCDQVVEWLVKIAEKH
ncbi:alpha/beta-hydrolase [Xylariaceae sp. FL0594]|nr:alpha/beta-hydrolase [Xylariaceae sp. FL0594]